VGLLLHDAARAGNSLLALYWVALYVLTGVAEEGLCHSVEPFAPLPKGGSPFRDASTRPVVRPARERRPAAPHEARWHAQVSAEAARLVLMAPLVALRWALFAGILLKFVVWRALLQARARCSPPGCAYSTAR